MHFRQNIFLSLDQDLYTHVKWQANQTWFVIGQLLPLDALCVTFVEVSKSYPWSPRS